MVAICAITAPTFVLSQAIDRFLRHRRRLAPNHLKREKYTSWLAMLFSTLGGIALILLSVFDVLPLPWRRVDSRRLIIQRFIGR
jgi:hypothetical protein